MIKKFFLFTGVLVLVGGAIYLLFLVSARQRQLTYDSSVIENSSFWSLLTNSKQNQSTPQLVDNQEKPKFDYDLQTSQGKEYYNTAIIKRGKFVSYDEKTKELQLVDDFSQHKDILSVKVDGIEAISCWPEVYIDNQGNSILLEKAYIPFAPDKPLAWPNEATLSWVQVYPTLDVNSYLIIKLAKPYALNQLNYVEQLVVLGC